MRRRRTPPRFLRRQLAALGVVLAAATLAAIVATGKGAVSRRQRSRESVKAHSARHTLSPGSPGPTAFGRTAPSERGPTETGPTGTVSESEESPRIRGLIALGRPIYCGGLHGNEVALTFDDGPGQYTRLALAKFEKHHIKATFFIVGRNIPLMPKAIGRERSLGAVGDHTFTHPLLTSLSTAQAESEIVRTQHAVAAASGGPVFLFRPPYGARDATIDAIAKAHGLLEIMWTVDSADSLGASYARIERNVISGLRPGAIVLMHENHGQTIRAMPSIFAALQRKHLRPVSVAKLLTDDPPSAAQVRAGGLGCGVRSAAGGTGG